MAPPKENSKGKATGRGRTQIKLGSLTHVGMVRSSNQDAYCAVLAPNAPAGTDALLAVADGMGGHKAGEVASTLAIHELKKRLSEEFGKKETSSTDEQQRATVLGDVIQQVNAEVHRAAANPETQGMGTTLTAAVVSGATLTLGHVGDSRAYLWRGGQMHQISQDHSWVAEEVAKGALPAEALRSHPQINILTRAIGTAPKVEVDLKMTVLQEGDVLLLCSDGLHGLVDEDEMAKTLAEQPLDSAAKTMVERANALGGNDNITVVLARMDKPTDEDVEGRGLKKKAQDATTITTIGRRKKRGALSLAARVLLLPFKLLWWLLRAPFRKAR